MKKRTNGRLVISLDKEQTLIRTDHAQGDEHCKVGLLLVCEEGKNTRQGGRLTERVIVDVVV